MRFITLIVLLVLTAATAKAQTDVLVFKYKGVNYFTLDAGYAYISGIQKQGQRYPVWVTAAHLFMEPRIMWAELEKGNWYVTRLRYLGNDICQVYFGWDSVSVEPLVNYPKGMVPASVNLGFYPKPKVAKWLVDGKTYDAIGSATFKLSDQDSLRGVLVKAATKPGDSGSGFIIEDQLCILIRGLGRSNIPGLTEDQLNLVEGCALVVPVKFGKPAP